MSAIYIFPLNYFLTFTQFKMETLALVLSCLIIRFDDAHRLEAHLYPNPYSQVIQEIFQIHSSVSSYVKRLCTFCCKHEV